MMNQRHQMAQTYDDQSFLWKALSNPSQALQIMMGSLVLNLLGLSVPLFTMLVFSRYLTHGLDATLVTLCAGVVISISLEYSLKRIRFGLLSAYTVKRDRLLSEHVYEHLLTAGFENLTQGAKSIRPGMVERHLDRVSSGMSVHVLQAFLDAPFTIIFIIALFFLAWPLALCALVILCVLIVLSYVRNRQYRDETQMMQQTRVQQMAALTTAQRYETMRITNAFSYMKSLWDKRSSAQRHARFTMDNTNDKTQNLTHLGTVMTSIVIIAVGAKLAVAGYLDFSGLIGANLLAARCVALVIKPLHQLSNYEQARQSLSILRRFLQMPTEKNEGVQLLEISGKLEFIDVAYRYAGQQQGPVFEGMSFTLKAGETLLVQGANSSGKTTLARLLAGLFQPVRGQVLLDGVDVRQLAPAWWRAQMVYMPQEPEFIEGTLRENVLVYNSNLDDENIMKLMDAVGLHAFVITHANGLDMRINDSGTSLSMGIRRRIALARALACSGKIVILDEPFIGLDAQGMRSVQKVMRQLHDEGRTMIILNSGDAIPQFTDHILNMNEKPTPTFTPFKPPVRGGANA